MLQSVSSRVSFKLVATMEIEGKTFLITGGASGLGALYAEAVLKEGAKAVAILDIAEEIGHTTAANLNNTYTNKVIFIKCNVTEEADIVEAFERSLEVLGVINVIVNNAGIMNDSPKVWRNACNVNWQGVVSFTFKGIKHMRKDEGGAGGTIVNIASVLGISKLHPLPVYSGSKSAVVHFSHTISEGTFYEDTRVRIVTLCPGATDTPLLSGLRHRAYDEKAGIALEEIDRNSPKWQRPESLVKAFVEIIKTATSGSVWIAAVDAPAVNVTPILDNYFKALEKFYS